VVSSKIWVTMALSAEKCLQWMCIYAWMIDLYFNKIKRNFTLRCLSWHQPVGLSWQLESAYFGILFHSHSTRSSWFICAIACSVHVASSRPPDGDHTKAFPQASVSGAHAFGVQCACAISLGSPSRRVPRRCIQPLPPTASQRCPRHASRQAVSQLQQRADRIYTACLLRRELRVWHRNPPKT
jgi:hypothetical protein